MLVLAYLVDVMTQTVATFDLGDQGGSLTFAKAVIKSTISVT
jgi:hypothetical protein